MTGSGREESYRSALALVEKMLLETLRSELRIHELRRGTLLCLPREVPDDVAKVAVQDSNGVTRVVVLCSSPAFPHQVEKGLKAAEDARRALGEELGSVILEPLLTGFLEGRSFAAVPYCKPFSDHPVWRPLQDWKLRPRVLGWLRAATTRTVMEPTGADAFTSPLQYLSSLAWVSQNLRDRARAAYREIERDGWRPRHVLTHGDLTRGNVLRASTEKAGNDHPKQTPKFVLIDWYGSRIRGYPFYDLIRLAMSMKLSHRGLRNEIIAHCEILGCNVHHARHYLSAALGYLGRNLNYFPFKSYLRLVENCDNMLNRALS
ncbi:MAG: phosphotransferase [Planctomycetes bacterium]|nr:phosphotransferase [Planctomycetota bacterium]